MAGETNAFSFDALMCAPVLLVEHPQDKARSRRIGSTKGKVTPFGMNLAAHCSAGRLPLPQCAWASRGSGPHSLFNTVTGSTRLARQAGTSAAVAATTRSSTATPANVTGSDGSIS